MSKLYFRHGAMCSAKTLNLLAVAHNYKSQDKKIFLIKPLLDTRFGEKITSRSGLSVEADVQVKTVSDLKSRKTDLASSECILVDEAQFLSVPVINYLRHVTIKHSVPVICYGLRTDFQTKLFPGSRRLMELADSIEEIKTTCVKCTRKAIFNMRMANNKPVFTGDQIVLGGNDSYVSVCASCYYSFNEHLQR